HQRTRGTGTPAASAARRSSNSWRRLDSITWPGVSRRSTSRSGGAPSRPSVKRKISRDAPPGRRARSVTVTGAPTSRPTNAASAAARSADVVQVLRPAVADAIAPAPLREALGDPRHDAVAAVAQRHHREHATGDLLGIAAVDGRDAHAERRVQLLRPGELALD